MTTLTRPGDTANEREVAARVGALWGATFHPYGFYDNIDWWVELNGACRAVAEIKARTHLPDTYPTVYLAMRKWLALTLVQMRGPVGLFIVRFGDGSIASIRVDAIDPRQQFVIRGRQDRPGTPNDREPILEVPVGDMEWLLEGE